MKPQFFIGLLLGLILGYFAGREHLKYELRSAANAAAQSLRQSLTNIFGDFGGDSEVKSQGRTEEADAARKLAEEQQKKKAADYARDFVIVSVQTAKYSTILGAKRAVVEGEVKNTGMKTIKRLTVTVYFQDAQGREIYEDECHPVLYAGSGSPLKPNYTSKLLAMPRDVPSDWSEGKVRAAITQIELKE